MTQVERSEAVKQKCVECGEWVREYSTPDEHIPGCPHAAVPDRAEAVKLAREVLEGMEACEWTAGYCSRCRGTKPAWNMPSPGHAPACSLATALTSARALLALLEKEAGGEGEGELRVEGWIAEDDGWMLASGQGYCVEFDPMPSTEFKKPARATLVVHPRTPPEQPARDPLPVSSGQPVENDTMVWEREPPQPPQHPWRLMETRIVAGEPDALTRLEQIRVWVDLVFPRDVTNTQWTNLMIDLGEIRKALSGAIPTLVEGAGELFAWTLDTDRTTLPERSIEDIAATGAAWVTEEELARVCALAARDPLPVQDKEAIEKIGQGRAMEIVCAVLVRAFRGGWEEREGEPSTWGATHEEAKRLLTALGFTDQGKES